MALIPQSGFSSTTSGLNDIPNEIPNTQADVLNNMPFVTDTNLNKYAIDTAAYPNTTKMLVGFAKGKRTLVTYYRQLRKGGSNIRSNLSDYPVQRDTINTEYQKIINLEITLPKGFDFEQNQGQGSVNISGEAMMYPNMNPFVGDVFTTGVGDGRIGVFQISNISITSWRTDRIYFVSFVLQSFMDSSDSDPIEGSVSITSIFSKENYLGGTAALLSEQTYLQLQKLKSVRGNLSKYYHQTFFSSELSSYLRPDGIYDPHAVQFMANKLSFTDVHIRPKNLMGQNQKLYKLTIWSRLEDRYNPTLAGIAKQYQLIVYQASRLGIFGTELHGRSVITPNLDLTDWDPYIFSDDFYTGNLTDMTAFEQLMYHAVTDRKAGDLTTFIANYIDTVYTLSLDDQYYRIPLYIHLIDMSLQNQYREIDAPSMNYASSGD